MQLCLHFFRSHFSFFARGWHSQRESKFLSRITGAEFAIPWAYSLFSIVFFFFSLSLQSSRPMYHQWELTPNFNPTSPTDRAVTWIRHDGSSAQGMVNNAHITQKFLNSVIHGETLAAASTLAFRNPSTFKAGNLHRHKSQWAALHQGFDNHDFPQVFDWSHIFLHIFEGVTKALTMTATLLHPGSSKIIYPANLLPSSSLTRL